MVVISANANELIVVPILSLRLAVGLLGERDGANWWRSGFMSLTSAAFLTPAFGSNVIQAKYQGVLESARRVHDEHIGVGRAIPSACPRSWSSGSSTSYSRPVSN
jgi:hypothetical protein